jgi:medium-chain acyl-[acyl-carrier-protein] hydrolase
MTRNSVVEPWIQYWQRRPKARVRLFCFPYAGGGASIFRNWSKHLPAEIEVCPVQLPGRESRLSDAPFSQIYPLVDSLAAALLPYLDVPYALFGHSMGSIISFEFARYLQRIEHQNPLHLFVSGHRAPQLPDPDPPMHHLPEPEFIEELRRLQGTPEEVLRNKELLRLLLPLLRADFSLCEMYLYQQEKPLSCPVTAFGGLQDEDVSRDSLALWREQTRGAFKLRFFMGGHFFLEKEQASLLSVLSQTLLSSQF